MVDYNLCSLKEFIIADSLLQQTYSAIITSLERDIAENNRLLRQSRKGEEEWKLLLKDLRYNKNRKKAIENSQRAWTKLRELNATVHIGCEGRTSCNQMVNEAMTQDTLERIKKLKEIE